MKTLSSSLQSHVEQEVTTKATIWKLERRDGAVTLGFTDHDADLVVDDGTGPRTYRADNGHKRTSIASSAGLAVDNLDVEGVFDDQGIDERDLVAGLWDHASISIAEVNWADPSQGVVRLRKGTLGEVRLIDGTWVAELRGLAQPLQQTIGEVYQATCTAELGDARCKVDLSAYTEAGTVASVVSPTIFVASGLSAQPDDYWAGGLVTWTSGANNGLALEVRSFDSATGEIELFLPVAFELTSGDTLSIYPGCRRRFEQDCRDKFANTVNFRGFPHVPIKDKIVNVPDQK